MMVPVTTDIVLGAAVVPAHGPLLVINFDNGVIFPVILGAAGDFENSHLVVFDGAA